MEKLLILSDLYQQCYSGEELSEELRNRLKPYSIQERKFIVSQKRHGCAPLFEACRNGNLNSVVYLVAECGADIEQRGLYFWDGGLQCMVTPIWCAASEGYLDVVKYLIKVGADIQAIYENNGSSVLRNACINGHLEVVAVLLRHGANISQPNFFGVTALMVSVCYPDLCRLLLVHGADINARDLCGRTALHYAIWDGQLTTTRLLLANGANPFLISLVNGTDALGTAAQFRGLEIFECLIAHEHYPPARIACGYELLGASYLYCFGNHNLFYYLRKRTVDHLFDLSSQDTRTALQCWRQAARVRVAAGLTKEIDNINIVDNPEHELAGLAEFRDERDLEKMADSLESLRNQALLIIQRILGRNHIWMSALTERGRMYEEAGRANECVGLYLPVLRLRMQRDTLLATHTYALLGELTRIFYLHAVKSDHISFDYIYQLLFILAEHLPACQKLVGIRPVHEKQESNFNFIFIYLSRLIFALNASASTCLQRKMARNLVSYILRLPLRTTAKGNSLLHIAVYMEAQPVTRCDHIEVVSDLLHCRANVDALNHDGHSPLMMLQVNYTHRDISRYTKVMQLLLNARAHVDHVTSNGKRVSDYFDFETVWEETGINLNSFINLKCLAARIIRQYGISYVGMVPKHLEPFIKMH